MRGHYALDGKPSTIRLGEQNWLALPSVLDRLESFARHPLGTTKVDFRNFTYHSSLCSQEFGKKGIGKTVRVRKGEFKNKNVYFAVKDNKVIYGDVTGDAREDAIVPIGCGAIMANFSLSEVYIYTIEDGRTTLLAESRPE